MNGKGQKTVNKYEEKKKTAKCQKTRAYINIIDISSKIIFGNNGLKFLRLVKYETIL